MAYREIIHQAITNAGSTINKAWPLYAFVTANPLAGFEDRHFEEAVDQARHLFNVSGLPSPQVLRQAWEGGHIDPERLNELFTQYEISQTPEENIHNLEKQAAQTSFEANLWARLDRLMTKWLSCFMDEGMAEWWMPKGKKGFYQAWKAMASLDSQIPQASKLKTLPADPYDSIHQVLQQYAEALWEQLITEQLAALPGWTGMIQYRVSENSRWQQQHPITLVDLLAVRLPLAHQLGYDLTPTTRSEPGGHEPTPERIWLLAWEQTYQNGLKQGIRSNMQPDPGHYPKHKEADAQLVFCIDTRSEVIRRHVEQVGNYETVGYAGFFGIPMNYRGYKSSLVRKSCPPILAPAYQVTEACDDAEIEGAAQYTQWQLLRKAFSELVTTFKNNVPASFGYVEGAGAYYGLSLTVRTLLPRFVQRLGAMVKKRTPSAVKFGWPSIKKLSGQQYTHEGAPDLPLEEKVTLAKTLFDLTGWQHFSRLVVLLGHGSETVNNPFGSSLDCGACAGSPGRYNARTLAHICNEKDVRQTLAEKGISIPDDTVFIAGEHNTTTDAIELFDKFIPDTYQSDLLKLRQDLEKAQKGASEERVSNMRKRSQDGLREVTKRSADWAETRPEWGLAGNAAFIIGPRTLTQSLNLEGRCFLHSYNWQQDPEGQSLQAIMNGPMVVTQWINNHYYFASVGNKVFGSGSKVTQNVVGKFGVLQGNGGDLKTGLPLQSLYVTDNQFYHQPLRLTVFIHAPVNNVKAILDQQEAFLKRLFDHEWLHLQVMDPEQDHKVISYSELYPVTASVNS